MSKRAKQVLWAVAVALVLAGLLWGFLLWFGNAMWQMGGAHQTPDRSRQALDACEDALRQRHGTAGAAGAVERGEMGPAYLATSTGSQSNVVEWKVQASFISQGTSHSFWCHGDQWNGSLRVRAIKKE